MEIQQLKSVDDGRDRREKGVLDFVISLAILHDRRKNCLCEKPLARLLSVNMAMKW